MGYQAAAAASLHGPRQRPPAAALSSRHGAAARLPIRRLVEALLAGAQEEAQALAAGVLRETGSRVSTIADLLIPAQRVVADLWYQGQATVADELRVADLLRATMASLPATRVGAPVPKGLRCVLAVHSGDPRDLSPQAFELALLDDGWTVDRLPRGARLGEIGDTLGERRTHLVAAFFAESQTAHLAAPAIGSVRRRVPVLAGGAAIERSADLWHRLGADGACSDVRVGVVLARRLALR